MSQTIFFLRESQKIDLFVLHGAIVEKFLFRTPSHPVHGYISYIYEASKLQ